MPPLPDAGMVRLPREDFMESVRLQGGVQGTTCAAWTGNGL